MAEFKFNPFTGNLDIVKTLEEAIAHSDLSDMPDVAGTVTDHDARYYTETELDAGQLDNRYYTETEIDNGYLKLDTSNDPLTDQLKLEHDTTGVVTESLYEAEGKLASTTETTTMNFFMADMDNGSTYPSAGTQTKVGYAVDNDCRHNQTGGTYDHYGGHFEMGSIAELPASALAVDHFITGQKLERGFINVGSGGGGSWNDVTAVGLRLTGWEHASDLFDGIAGTFTRYAIHSDGGDVELSGGKLYATGFDCGDANIENVGDISLDSLSSDGAKITVNLDDATANAFEFVEGANNYMFFDTRDGAEAIWFRNWKVGIYDTDLRLNNIPLRIYDDDGDHYMGLDAPAVVTADVTLVLPDGDGNANEVLGTDGAANLIWRTHDELAGFVANEHIDWTNASQNLVTTGDITSNGGYVKGDEIRANGDVGGAAGNTSMTNAVTGAAGGVVTINRQTAGTTTNAGWVKFYVGTVAYGMPMVPWANL